MPNKDEIVDDVEFMDDRALDSTIDVDSVHAMSSEDINEFIHWSEFIDDRDSKNDFVEYPDIDVESTLGKNYYIDRQYQLITKIDEKNPLYQSNEIYEEACPGFFQLFHASQYYPIVANIIKYLELYDLRFLAMSTRGLYNNFYNPGGTLFQLLVNKWDLSNREEMNKLTERKEKRMRLLAMMVQWVSDLDQESSDSHLIIDDYYIGTCITLAFNQRYISCYVKHHHRFYNIVEVMQPHDAYYLHESAYHDKSNGTRFKTIRHWLAHCLGCELHQLDMKELSNQIKAIDGCENPLPNRCKSRH